MDKAGFAGEDHSCAVFSFIIVYPSFSNQMIGIYSNKNENAVFQKYMFFRPSQHPFRH